MGTPHGKRVSLGRLCHRSMSLLRRLCDAPVTITSFLFTEFAFSTVQLGSTDLYSWLG